MHCLVGIFLTELPIYQMDGVSYWSIKLIFPPNKSRFLYFKSEEECKKWIECIKDVAGIASIFDYYSVENILASGSFGVVSLATNKQTGVKVAIKQI